MVDHITQGWNEMDRPLILQDVMSLFLEINDQMHFKLHMRINKSSTHFFNIHIADHHFLHGDIFTNGHLSINLWI